MKLLSTVALALLLGAGAASAQAMSKEPPERAPAAQQKAPAEKVAPSMKDEHKSSQTTGQATPDSKATGKGHETTGQSPKSEAPDKAGSMNKDKAGSPSGQSDMRTKSEQNGAASKSTQGTTEQNRSTTTGQGAAAGSAKLSTE